MSHSFLGGMFSLCLALFLLQLSALIYETNATQLRIVAAKQDGGFENWDKGPFLSGNTTLCRRDIPNPFTVACIPSEDQKSSVEGAMFYVNGKLFNSEQKYPYIMTGDDGMEAYPYKGKKGAVSIKCMLSNNEMAEAYVNFDCEGSSEPMRVIETPGEETAIRDSLSLRGMKQKSSRMENMKDVFVSEKCIRIPSKAYRSIRGWDISRNFIEFRRGDNRKGIVQPNVAPVVYKFKPMKESIYAIAVDMTTRDNVDHNDVWLRLPNVDFKLWKGNSKPMDKGAAASDWVKGFHNRNGRKVETKTIDFKGYVLTSRTKLKRNREYEIVLAGRSTKVIVHNIVLVACNGTAKECSDTPYRAREQEKCARAGM